MLAKAKEMLERARQVAVGLSDLEIKVENATNNDPWGPHGSLMSDISSAAFDADGYKEIVGVLAQRLHGEPKNWRQVYKSLLLLEYMLKNGPMRIVNELQSSARLLERLQRFEYRDEKGKDQGLNVRNRAKLLLELANDPERVKQEREKAAKNRNKYGGVSSDQSMSFGGSGSRGFRGDGYGATDTSGGGGLSSYSRDSNGAGSRSNDGGQAEEELEDAVEATKNRIQQLDLAADTAGGSGAESAAAATPGKKTPKRLSEVKVSPMIAAGLGKAGPPPAAAPAAAVAVAAAPPPAADLLGGLHDTPATPAAPAAAPASDLLGGLEAASPAPEPEAEQWDAFQDAQAAPAAAAGAAASADPFSTLAGSEAQPRPSGFDALVAPTPAAASGVDALHVAAAAPAAAKPAGAATPVALDESLFAAPAAPTSYAAANGAAGMAAPGMPPMMGAPGGFGAAQAMPHPAAAAAFPHRPAMPFPGGGYAMPQAGASGMMPAAVPGAMPGPMPGAMPGAMHGAMPRVMPGTMPGAMPGVMPSTMPGAMPGVMPSTMPGAMPGVMPGAMPAHMRSAGGAAGGAAAVKLGAPGRARSGQKDPFADLNVL